MKNRKSTVIWVLFICLMLFAACGRQDQEETQEATGEIQTEASGTGGSKGAYGLDQGRL